MYSEICYNELTDNYLSMFEDIHTHGVMTLGDGCLILLLPQTDATITMSAIAIATDVDDV